VFTRQAGEGNFGVSAFELDGGCFNFLQSWEECSLLVRRETLQQCSRLRLAWPVEGAHDLSDKKLKTPRCRRYSPRCRVFSITWRHSVSISVSADAWLSLAAMISAAGLPFSNIRANTSCRSRHKFNRLDLGDERASSAGGTGFRRFFSRVIQLAQQII